MSGGDTHENLHKSCSVSEFRSLWYFSQKELEMNSPSRMDGIDWTTENQLRASYCSFIQTLGIQLGKPQVTIATAIVLCHRFYLRQSHSKNDWETIATVCLFVASKVEETPCYLDKITSVAYQLKHRKNPAAAAQRIQVKEVFLRQKELILVGETLLLATIGFDLNVQHPYKPLTAAVKRLGLPNNVARMACDFLNDWLRTTLYLQYKPHYIAAGSLYLAAKINNVRLPSDKGHVWWQEFDVLPRQLDESVQHMMEVMGYKRRVAVPDAADKTVPPPTAVKETQQSNSSESCISHGGSSPMVDNVLEHGATFTKQGRCPDCLFPNITSGCVCGKSGFKRQYMETQCCSGGIYHGNMKNASGKIRSEYPRCAATQDIVISLPNRLDVNMDTERIREKLKRRRLEHVNSVDATYNPRQQSWGRHQ